MKRTTLLVLTCVLAMGPGCKDSDGHDHGGESHEEHAGHDDHEADEQGHEEHAGEEEAHDDQDHGEEGHDEHTQGDEHGEEQVVRISPEALSRNGIRLGTAEAGVLASALEVPAEVQMNPDRVAHISHS